MEPGIPDYFHISLLLVHMFRYLYKLSIRSFVFTRNEQINRSAEIIKTIRVRRVDTLFTISDWMLMCWCLTVLLLFLCWKPGREWQCGSSLLTPQSPHGQRPQPAGWTWEAEREEILHWPAVASSPGYPPAWARPPPPLASRPASPPLPPAWPAHWSVRPPVVAGLTLPGHLTLTLWLIHKTEEESHCLPPLTVLP